MLETLKFGEGNWANKTDSTLAYSDQYGNFQAIPFDFTRATTATRVNKQGLIESVNEGIARINYSDSTQGALLLEPQRTNLMQYSNNFTNWSTIGNPTLNSNHGVSPDGKQNSTRVQMASGDRIYKGTTLVSDASFSVYLKGSGEVRLRNSANTVFTEVTLTSEWVRYYNVGDFTSNTNVQIQCLSGVSDFEMYGAQFEEGSYATSYIPTNGAIATRNQELCNDATPEINSAEGVLYAEISALANDGEIRYLGLNDGSNDNRVVILYHNSNDSIRAILSSGGTKYVDVTSNVTSVLDFHKVAIRYSSSEFSLWIDGVEVATDTSLNVPIGLNNLDFSINGGGPFYGNTKGVKLYNTALTDAQLQTLTTI